MSTDNEIIKALNGADGLGHISIYCADNNGKDVCSIKLVDIIDLINRQQAEIERLQNALFKQEDTMQMIIKERDAEIESLKNDLAKEFTCFVGSPHKVESCPFFDELENERAEAVKEFAERLKNEITIRTTHSKEQDELVLFYIDNLVKEMVGENNG